MSNESLLGYQNDSGLRFFKSGSRRTAKMSALVNLPPDVPQDMEQEDVVELLIPGNNMETSVIIQCEYCGGGSPTWGKSLGMYHIL